MSEKKEFLQRKRRTNSPKTNKNKDKINKKNSGKNNFNEINNILEEMFKKEDNIKINDKKKSEISLDEPISNDIEVLQNKSTEELKEFFKQNHFEAFIEKKEYEFFLFGLMKYVSKIFLDNKLFTDDYTNYIYNNLKALQNSKELNDILKKVAYNKENEFLFMEFLKFTNLRWEKFIEAGIKYKIDLLENYLDSINPENKNKNEISNNDNNNDEKFDKNKAIEIFQNFPEKNQLELFIASIVYNSMIKNEQGGIKNKNEIIEDKLEVQNFNLEEMAMISVLTGIKYNKNIIEINLCCNPLTPKSLYWLGSCTQTLPFLSYIDISRCNIDNDKLYMFVEGTNFSEGKIVKEQFNLKRLNLKDNPNIKNNDNKNNEFDHPISLILEKFKLNLLNLTNAKLGGKGMMKIFKKMNYLLNNNKLFLKNLIIINNNIENEECLSEIGELLLKDNCPLQKLILSKNMISTFPNQMNNNKINYFEKFMKCVAKSKLEELFLINCDIGNSKEDINILYEMLKENKSLTSVRLFGNKISDMESFSKILGIFSDYNKELENKTLKSLDLSKNQCDLKIDENFMRLIENLKLEYLDVNQNTIDDKEIFRKRANALSNIRIIY